MLDFIAYGVASSVGWGSADFIARFTSRAVGLFSALLGMMLISAVVLSCVVWYLSIPIVYDLSASWKLLSAGLCFLGATLMLYWGLSRGPVTVVAPIAGAFPVFNLLFAIATGVRPTLTQWVAMAMVMFGVAVVAACAKRPAPREVSNALLGSTILIAFGASLGLAAAVATGQAAISVYGEVQTVWMMRWVGVLTLALIFVTKREKPVLPVSWWPVLGVQGVLDTSAYLLIFLGSQGIGAQVTVVIGSTFSAVTVILGRFILKESMSISQWGGLVLIVAGVALLSA